MKLTFDQIRAAARGCAYSEEKDGALWLYRFNRQQMEFYRQRDPEFFRKAHSTSGVVVEFDTDSPTLFLAVTASTGSSRRFVAHSIYINGVLLAHFGDTIPAECPAHDLEGSYDLGEGTKRVKILFPWASASRIRELRLASGSSFQPVKKDFTLILYGDSITQGYDALYPENSYATIVTSCLDANGINKAIGGEVFCPELATLPDEQAPDLITVAYGTNDWSTRSWEDFRDSCRGFYHNLRKIYPNTPIIALAPIWRADTQREEQQFPFPEVAKHICAVVEEIGNAFFLDCFDYVPHDPNLFSDLYLHPNDDGFRYYGEALCAAVRKIFPTK